MLDNTFEVVWLIGFVAGSVIRAGWTLPHRRRNKQRRILDDRMTKPEWLLLCLTSLGLIIFPLLYVFTNRLDFADYALPTWASLAAGWVGVPVFVIALWLLWRSHADLGRNWSPKLEIREGQTLVTQGVFRHVRHPMYTAHWLWAIAQALLLQNWIAGLAMLASFLPLYLLRVVHEEQMMLEYFGEEYRSYMNRTGRVIPRLWSECPPSAKSGRERTRG